MNIFVRLKVASYSCLIKILSMSNRYRDMNFLNLKIQLLINTIFKKALFCKQQTVSYRVFKIAHKPIPKFFMIYERRNHPLMDQPPLPPCIRVRFNFNVRVILNISTELYSTSDTLYIALGCVWDGTVHNLRDALIWLIFFLLCS